MQDISSLPIHGPGMDAGRAFTSGGSDRSEFRSGFKGALPTAASCRRRLSYLLVSANSLVMVLQRPDAQELQKLVMPVASQMQAAGALPKDRRSSAGNHCKTAAAALQALSWLVYTGPGCGAQPVP